MPRRLRLPAGTTQRLRLALLILLGAGLWGAGAREASADTCVTDADCLSGSICSNGVCVTCTTDADCPSGETCYDGKCVACKVICDCPQGQFCYYGTCISDPKMPVYCCSKPGCVPGAFCYDTKNAKTTRAEDPTWVCQDACDCGPATACLAVSGVGKTCVKDQDDPWLKPGSSIFGVTVPAGEPTYCCGSASCASGWYAYSQTGQAAGFLCFDARAGVPLDYCTGTVCHTVDECDAGESCVDTRTGSTAKPGTSCSAEGGFCKSNAVAEVVYNWSSSDFLSACSDTFSGAECEAGWRPGGVYAVQ